MNKFLEKARIYIESRFRIHFRADREYWEKANFFQKLKALNELFWFNTGLKHEKDDDWYMTKEEVEEMERRLKEYEKILKEMNA